MNLLDKKIDFFTVISKEQKPGKGEDSYLLDRMKDVFFLGVFDGCGGSGARIYPEFGGHSGAYIASRVVALETERWLNEDKSRNAVLLEKKIRETLIKCKEKSTSDYVLSGSIIKDFPTTMSALCIRKDAPDNGMMDVTLINAGDSRCYCLSPQGLLQLTKDDLPFQDALKNIYESAPLTNTLYASEKSNLSIRHIKVKMPCILFAASDGCFDYFRSPMQFEYMLLKTMADSHKVLDWEEKIEGAIGTVAGDDYTLVMAAAGFGTFSRLKSAYLPRLNHMMKEYPETDDMEKILAQWEIYRKEYEKF